VTDSGSTLEYFVLHIIVFHMDCWNWVCRPHSPYVKTLVFQVQQLAISGSNGVRIALGVGWGF